MSQDQFEEFEEFISTCPEISQYLQCCRKLNDNILSVLYSKGEDQGQKIRTIDTMRKTAYLTLSEYFPEIFKKSSLNSGVSQIAKKYTQFYETNKDYFHHCQLSFGIKNGMIVVKTRACEFIESPIIHPSVILAEAGIKSENYEDFHLFIGMLLPQKIFYAIQFAQAVLLTSQKLRRVCWKETA